MWQRTDDTVGQHYWSLLAKDGQPRHFLEDLDSYQKRYTLRRTGDGYISFDPTGRMVGKSTDAAIAIGAALSVIKSNPANNYGGLLEIGPGHFFCDTTIPFCGGIALVGQGESTKLFHSPSLSVPFIANASGPNQSEWSIRNLMLSGTTCGSFVAIDLSGMGRGIVDSVSIERVIQGAAIYSSGGSDGIIIHGCSFATNYSSIRAYYANYWRIINNHAQGDYSQSIDLGHSDHILVQGNDLVRCDGITILHGESCIVIGNTVIDGDVFGLSLEGSTRHCICALNNFVGSGHQVDGIRVSGSAVKGNIIVYNQLVGNASYGINWVYPVAKDNIVFGNYGGTGSYIDARKGIATIASGDTTVTLAHGLETPPTIPDVQVTPLLWGSASKVQAAIDGTYLSLEVDADPGAGTAQFVYNIGAGL